MIKFSPEEYIQKFKVSNDIINNTEIITNFINEKIDLMFGGLQNNLYFCRNY